MNRIEKLESFIELRDAEKELKERMLQREIELLKDEIKARREKAVELITLGKICRNNNIRFPYAPFDSDYHPFVANSRKHNVGLNGNIPFNSISFIGGCDYQTDILYNPDDNTVKLNFPKGKEENTIKVLNKFIAEFDVLYDEFTKWVDDLTTIKRTEE